MPPRLALGRTDSAGETVQRMLPNSKVVKAFNIVGNPHMIHPDFPGGPPTMFICGNDSEAKKNCGRYSYKIWLGNNRYRWSRRCSTSRTTCIIMDNVLFQNQ
jgi:hypothetical protein